MNWVIGLPESGSESQRCLPGILAQTGKRGGSLLRILRAHLPHPVGDIVSKRLGHAIKLFASPIINANLSLALSGSQILGRPVAGLRITGLRCWRSRVIRRRCWGVGVVAWLGGRPAVASDHGCQ